MTAADSLRHDVGQILWIGFDGTTLPAEVARRFRDGNAGAAVLFARNLATVQEPMSTGALPGDAGGAPGLVRQAMAGEVLGDRIPAATVSRDVTDIEALVELCAAIHATSGSDLPPALIAIDQEGGRVQRVRAPATVWPPMLQLETVRTGDSAALAEAVGRAMGEELASLGINIDFAPVLDVHTNPGNPVIGDRAFATSPDAAADRALAFARGLAAAGVLGCGKHFPGHGDTSIDSHLALPRLEHDLDRLRAVELVPFSRAAATDIPMIMTAHVVFDVLDPSVPATLSERAITDLLKTELGYRGVVVSDDLDMKAISDNFGVGDAAVRAVMAGCDVLLLCRDPHNQREAQDALLRAGTDRPDVRRRIAAAATAVRDMKRRHHLAGGNIARAREVLARSEHRALADRLR